MRILLIAYACAPGEGSEPGIGWNVAETLSHSHEVHVLTRSKNRTEIERHQSQAHWHYFDTIGKRLKRHLPFGIQAYHYLWQIRARHEVKRIIAALGPFDYAQHLTLGSLRYPSAASVAGVPVVIGPVGGGEMPPFWLWRHLGFVGLIHEGLRAMANWAVALDPVVRRSWRRARVGLATSYPSASRIRRLAPGLQVHVQPNIGIPPSGTSPNTTQPRPPSGKGPMRLVSIGRQEPWKGFAIQVKALALLRDWGIDATLTLLGTGRDRRRLVNLCSQLGLSDGVSFIDQVPHTDVYSLLIEHNVFVSTSMRESGGMALIEAMDAGLPSIALAAGGPALTLDGLPGALIPVERDSVRNVAAAIAILRDPVAWGLLAAACRERAQGRYAWPQRVSQIQEVLTEALNPLRGPTSQD
jgi:glycosyltransferase involved in cell wall biosynthesis